MPLNWQCSWSSSNVIPAACTHMTDPLKSGDVRFAATRP